MKSNPPHMVSRVCRGTRFRGGWALHPTGESDGSRPFPSSAPPRRVYPGIQPLHRGRGSQDSQGVVPRVAPDRRTARKAVDRRVLRRCDLPQARSRQRSPTIYCRSLARCHRSGITRKCVATGTTNESRLRSLNTTAIRGTLQCYAVYRHSPASRSAGLRTPSPPRRRAHVGMPQQLLHRPEVVPGFQQVAKEWRKVWQVARSH